MADIHRTDFSELCLSNDFSENPQLIDWNYYLQKAQENNTEWVNLLLENIDKERFLAFISGYKKKYGLLKGNWRTVLENGYLGKLGWLEYNLKRSLWIECTDSEEQQMGTDQVNCTINAIRRYGDMIPELEKWLNNEI